ncbi:IS3 family transposase [Candidatus Phytoplasma meliae]|uniref:IS3 family transposase n=1 Tax=Candidatus Phytoplasma meliae TaxID=1848402 RepID=A0ABS5CXS3_9MOLU|nr:IS3 family transposase [Candidatus Phytoplasma meliae]MBP5835769.1 IS3 family transposase [Candidatus Phytoplasma meliae]MBP5836220.1 IS3 family transposase [Candidatus Phytoplasma meliae]
MRPKHNQTYSEKVKWEAILAWKRGSDAEEIAKQLNITNHHNIYYWFNLSKKNDFKGFNDKRKVKGIKRKAINFNDPKIKQIIKDYHNNKNKDVLFNAIKKLKAKINITQLMQHLQLARSTFYYCKKEKATPEQDHNLITNIKLIADKFSYTNKRGDKIYTLGWRSIFRELKLMNINKTSYQIQKIMKDHNLFCKTKQNTSHLTKKKRQEKRENLLRGNKKTTKEGQIYCTDITAIPYGRWNNIFYLSTIMDLHTKKIINYNLGSKQDQDFVLKTLNGIKKVENDCFLHSDRGTQYQANQYGEALKAKNIKQSFSRPRTPRDNPYIENFFSQFKLNTIHLEHKEDLTKLEIIKITDNFIKQYNDKRNRIIQSGYTCPFSNKKKKKYFKNI